MGIAALASPTGGAIAALGCALAWTLLTLIARTLAPYFSAFSLNIIRSGVGGLILTLAALMVGDLAGLRHVSWTAWVYVLTTVIVAVGIGDTAFFEASRTLGLARAMTISTTYPLLATGLAVWLFGERVTRLEVAGAVVTLGGLGLIVSDVDGGPARAPADRRKGWGLALVCTLAWALSAVFMKAPLGEVDPLTIQAARLPLTTLLLWATPWARGTARALWTHRRVTGARVLALGALTAASAVMFLTGLKYAGMNLGTVLSSTAPLFALPIGLLAFGERVTWRAAAGAALCITGIALLSL